MKQHEKILKALANKRRLEIIKFLKTNKEANVGEIAGHIKLSFRATSKHLSVLSGADILDKEQRSLSSFYSLNTNLLPMAKAIISLV